MSTICLCLFFTTDLTGNAHAQHVTVSKKDIETAWKKRESLIRSVEYSWEETELIRAHSVRQILTNARKRIPENDLELTRQRSIELSGKMSRHTSAGDSFNPQDGTSRKKKYVSVCDGLVAKNFHDSAGTAELPMAGFIYKEARSFDITIYPLLPVVMFARPLQRSLGGIDLDEYVISHKRGYCDGRECIILESQIPSPENGKYVYWIDAEQNYIIRRFEEKYGASDGPAFSSIEIEFDVHADFGWVPTRWKVSYADASNRFSMRVTQSKFNNELEVDRFRFQFPNGTEVVDLRTGERFIAGARSDERRIITNAELQRGATHQELMKTRSGEARGRNAESSNASKYSFIFMLLTAISIAAIVSTWKKSRVVRR